MVLAHCMSPNVGKYFYEVSWSVLNGFQVGERTRFCHWNCYLQSSKGITQTVYIQELCFLQSAHRLKVVNISMTFHGDILNGLLVTELQSGRHCILFSAYPKLWVITQKIYIQKLWLLRYAHCLMFVNISMTFHEDILNGFQATERTSLYIVLGIAKVKRDITKKYISKMYGSCDLHIV